jgi:hypothetical protein
MDREKVLFAMH